MKIKGKIFVEYEPETSMTYAKIILKIKFKLPNQFFYRKKERVIVDMAQKHILTKESFYDNALRLLSNTEYLKSVGKMAIVDYIDNMSRKEREKIKAQEMLKKLKELKDGIDIEFEYDLKGKNK